MKCTTRAPFSCAGVTLIVALLSLAVSCVPTPSLTPVVTHRPPTYAEITPGSHKAVPDLSTTIDVPPFPYATPLPPPVSSALDGLYSKTVPFEGTPVPCKRCAGYRMEGGVWTLYLDKGIFKVFQRDTDFEAVGSFVVSEDRITFFNDPYCEEDLRMVGIYTWELDADGSLRLKVIGDPCSIGLRAKNLTSSPWIKLAAQPGDTRDPCQPPNREAAVSGHWPEPPECQNKP
jgi:hypothetical protein